MAVLCGVLALAGFGLWSTRRTWGPLIVMFVALGLSGASFVIDALVETPSEKVASNLYDLVDAFQKQDSARTLGHFSQQPKVLPIKAMVQAALKTVQVKDDVRVSDVSVKLMAEESQAIVHFRANASVSLGMAGIGDVGYQPSRWELTWQKEAGEWKISEVQRLDPITGKPLAFFGGSL